MHFAVPSHFESSGTSRDQRKPEATLWCPERAGGEPGSGEGEPGRPERTSDPGPRESWAIVPAALLARRWRLLCVHLESAPGSGSTWHQLVDIWSIALLVGKVKVHALCFQTRQTGRT